MAQETQVFNPVCLYCGSSEFIWGALTNPQGKVVFHPDGPFFTLASTAEPVRARKCAGCGNIQCFSEQQNAN